MNLLIETVIDSIQELLGYAIKLIPALIAALIIIMLTRYAAQFLQNMSSQLAHKTVRSESLQILLTKASYLSAWIIGIVVACVLVFPGLRLGDIIATLGLGSVAIGFAFQDIFKNFLAGILILLQEPFRINDQIIVGNYEGTVEKIEIRTTRIRTYTDEIVLLPNSTVFTSAVQVRTALACRRTDLAVEIDYNTSLGKATEILLKTIQKVEGVVENPSPEIDLVSFGESSIDFIVRYWTKPHQKEVRRTQTRAIIAIKHALDSAKINIPYPIRTLYFYNQTQLNDTFEKNNSRSSENKLSKMIE